MRRHLFLYLTLLCFLGLIAIFIVDGWMGIYDTLYITTGEYEQRIEPDSWLQEEKYGARGAGVNQGERAFFRYEVDNRRFSSYEADIEVSVWHSQEKVRDIVTQQIVVGALDREQAEWVIDTAEILPSDLAPEQSYNFTVMITRGDIERSVILYVNPAPYVPKPAPVR